jgi:DNA polymerase III subunit delta'
MSWDKIPPQPRAIRFLRQLAERERIPHALLLTGMTGIGKAALAKEFAKLVNCLQPADGEVCDGCAACHKIDSGHHPDLIWLAPDGQFIKIEQIRSLQGRLRFRPFEGKNRVIVIQDAQQLREEAGNALLKILEEPPRNNIILLLALEPQMLLPTLVSRCCQVRLQPLPDAWIAHYLVQNHGLPAGRAEQVASQALGSLTRALQMVETDQLEQRQKVLATLNDLGNAPMLDFFQTTAKWAKETQDLLQDLDILQSWVRDGIMRRLRGHGPRELGTAAMEPESRVLTSIPIDHMFAVHEHIDRAMQHVRGNANRQLTLEGVCLIIKDLVYGKGNWNSIPGGWQDLSL